MIKDGYVLLKPDSMDTANAKNYHVIEARFNTDTNTLSFPDGRTVVCRNWEMKSGASVDSSQIVPRNDDKLRLCLAEEQNAGKRICANCAKHFYADGV